MKDPLLVPVAVAVCESCRQRTELLSITFEDGEEFLVCLDCLDATIKWAA